MQDNTLYTSGDSEFLEVAKKKDSWAVQNLLSERAIEGCLNYAVKMAEQAVEQMREGVVVVSPSDEKACEFCNFKPLCQQVNPTYRSVQKVDADVIIDASEKEV